MIQYYIDVQSLYALFNLFSLVFGTVLGQDGKFSGGESVSSASSSVRSCSFRKSETVGSNSRTAEQYD